MTHSARLALPPPFPLHRSMRYVLAAGDAAIILLFALLGRGAHHENGSPAYVLTTALPFLAGWYVAASVGAIYERTLLPWRWVIRDAAVTALAGGLLGLLVRSVLERRPAPVSFALVALSFLTVLLTAWHAAARAVIRSD